MVIDKLDKWLKKTVAGGKEIGSNSENKDNKFRHKKQRRPFNKGGNNNHKPKLKIIPVGGVEEVGKNMTIFECGRDIVIVDMGFQFPEEDMFGVDYVIPDVTYLDDKIERIRGIIITHAHLDHIGAIPYLFKKFGNIPFYGTKLTIGLVKKKLEEFGYDKIAKLIVIDPDKDEIRLGSFKASFFRVNHSIPDGVGVVLDSPQGKVVHTGDFKFDFTPADGIQADYAKIAALSGQNIIAMLSDSTNATKPGHTISEKTIGDTLDGIIENAKGRIIIASFSSLIGRIQQIIDSAVRHRRQVFVTGRSLLDNIDIATKLGYLKYPNGLIRDLKRLKGQKPSDDCIILTTGTQGEAVSALTRMAVDDHPDIKIRKTDTVVLSSTPIIGNEQAVINTINNLTMLGANVITNNIMDVHTSGHGQQEDLKLMLSLVKPKYLIPVHGLLYMRKAHGKLASSMGMPEENVILVDNGSIVEVGGGKARISQEKAEAKYILVDGLGVGGVGAQVLKERQEMAQNGIIMILFKVDKKTKKMVREPKIMSRGFLYAEETEHIEKLIIENSKEAYNRLLEKDADASWDDLKNFIRGSVDRFSHKKINRRPLIEPIIIAV